MNEREFRRFLYEKQLAEMSIDHYCNYIRSMARIYRLSRLRLKWLNTLVNL